MAEPRTDSDPRKSLSLTFATCCIIDLFGVFPVIALPRAIVECGLLGIPLALVVLSLQIYTAILLGKCWIIAESLNQNLALKNRSPYAGLAELAYGRGVSRLVTFILNLSIFGCGVPNFIIAAQNLQIIGLKLSEYEMDFSYCYWMAIIGVILCPLMWLGSPKDMKWVAVTSVFTVLSSCFLTWHCLLNVPVTGPPEIPSPTFESVAIAYGILSFQFDIHPMVLTVQMDMKNKSKLGQAIISGFVVSGTMFLVTSAIIYTRMGTAIHYNTLQGLPGSPALYTAVLLVTLQICLSMVVGTTALFQDLEHKLKIDPSLNWKRIALRSLMVAVAVLIGESVPRFDLIMGLLGGALNGQLMFIFPPLIYARLRTMQMRHKMDQIVFQHPSAPPYDHIPFSSESNGFHQYGTMNNAQYYSTKSDSVILLNSRNDPTTFEDNMSIYPSEKLLQIMDRPRPYGLRGKDKQNLYKRVNGKTNGYVRNAGMLDDVLDEGPMTIFEKGLNALLVLCGIGATLLATYYSLKETIEYGEFVSPCLVNITSASSIVRTMF